MNVNKKYYMTLNFYLILDIGTFLMRIQTTRDVYYRKLKTACRRDA